MQANWHWLVQGVGVGVGTPPSLLQRQQLGQQQAGAAGATAAAWQQLQGRVLVSLGPRQGSSCHLPGRGSPAGGCQGVGVLQRQPPHPTRFLCGPLGYLGLLLLLLLLLLLAVGLAAPHPRHLVWRPMVAPLLLLTVLAAVGRERERVVGRVAAAAALEGRRWW